MAVQYDYIDLGYERKRKEDKMNVKWLYNMITLIQDMQEREKKIKLM